MYVCIQICTCTYTETSILFHKWDPIITIFNNLLFKHIKLDHRFLPVHRDLLHCFFFLPVFLRHNLRKISSTV